MSVKVYECQNERCPLGTADTKGKFSGGLTPEGAAVLGLDPETPTGDGICPNCGKPGKSLDETQVFNKGTDPYARHHKAIHARVLDEADNLTADDAQAALMELVPEKQAVGGGDDE